MRIPFASLLLIAVALSTGGCVQTAMLPADQLEDGQTAVSASVTEPGAGLFPRLSAQATYGLGEGDITGTVSALPARSFPALGAGVTGRYYASPHLSAELQLQVSSFSREDESRRRTAGLVLAGLQTVPTDEASWYYGAQAGIIRGPSPDVYIGLLSEGPPAGEVQIWTDPVIGATAGYGPVKLGSSTRMQIEAKANLPIWGSESEPPIPASGLSVGFFGLFGE